MLVSEYIADFLVRHNIRHVFGYQGTMIAYFIDAICKNPNLTNHCCYHEQGAAFAACGYAKVTGELAVAYATSGPGALNLISGIADAFYDSAPVLFITGQLNTTEYTDVPELRQQGFQQTDVVRIAKPITKYAVKIEQPDQIADELPKAVRIAMDGRKGPVLLDIPMNIQRAEISDPCAEQAGSGVNVGKVEEAVRCIIRALSTSKRPILLLGNGVAKDGKTRTLLRKLVEKYKIPVISSLLGKDLLPEENPFYLGYLGSGYGYRCANIIAYNKTDLIISLGCSMCRRQTGGNTEGFAKQAKIIRVDIDENELRRKVHSDEMQFLCDANMVIHLLAEDETRFDFADWAEICRRIKALTQGFDRECPERFPNKYIEVLSRMAPDNTIAVSDVGQHQMWMAQSFSVRAEQRILFSGGHGAMGFALPAAIGAYYAEGRPVVCVAGDGAFQMNIQELQWVTRERIPVTIIVLNNHTLGLIQQQQDDFFAGNHFGSTEEGGYTAPSFREIAKAYEIAGVEVSSLEEFTDVIGKYAFRDFPVLIEVHVDTKSRAYPKTYFGERMDNQRPYLDRALMEEIQSL